jgi:hypothetical protein
MAYTTIDKPSDYFNTKLYTGNGGTQSITGLDFAPNWVWLKARSAVEGHAIFDTVRGVQKRIGSNGNDVENDQSSYLTAFGTEGFTVGSSGLVNSNSTTYVSWNWKESTVAGFDIIAYQGTGSNLDLSHNLSAIPDWIMIKDRDVDQAWRVYHKSMGFSNRLVLPETGAKSTSALGLDADPTSSVINIGTGTGTTNTNGDNYICYAFKNVQGFSKFGSYTGNGNADGTFVYTGFKPAWVMMKRTNTTGSWTILDSKRNTSNVLGLYLLANTSGADVDFVNLDFLSNGFKLRNSSFNNGSGDTIIYMAFAENPFVTSTGVPATAR